MGLVLTGSSWAFEGTAEKRRVKMASNRIIAVQAETEGKSRLKRLLLVHDRSDGICAVNLLQARRPEPQTLQVRGKLPWQVTRSSLPAKAK